MRRRRDTLRAIAAYSGLALVLTWPLARGLARDVPGDFGDPLLSAWIVARDADHLERAMAGHPAALRDYWNAAIFAPHPLTLAYSEHMTAQALQVLPIHVLSKNPILSYNLLFLSTFILSAWGMFLLVRDLTGNSAAAFLAGLAFGFAPYRIGSIPHLPVLSSAWMPFTLLGFRRFFAARRVAPLAGGAAAWIAQNLSCGYYLLFFSPIVGLYLLWELTTRRLWGDWKTVTRVSAMIAGVVIVTVPFLIPYAELRRLGFAPRPAGEIARYGADVYGYFTAHPGLRVWGAIARAWPAPEGSLFPGLTITSLAGVAIVDAWRRSRYSPHSQPPQAPQHFQHPHDLQQGAMAGPTTAARALGWLLAAASATAIAGLLGWSVRIPSTRPLITITSWARELALAAGIGVTLLAISAHARTTARRLLASPVGLFAVVTLFAAAMSLGPEIHSRGRLIEKGAPYSVFSRAVPGFDGLRVPARFGTIVAFGLAALAGSGAAVIARWRNGWLVVAASALVVVESFAAPITINGNDTEYDQRGLAPLPGALAVGEGALPVYAFVARLPETSVLLELPAGEPAFDVRYMLYALPHKRALVNGYSGGVPEDYALLTGALKEILERPDYAWHALAASAATHVIVHEAGYEPGRGQRISAWLAAHGAREIAAFDGDRVFVLR
jgi:hypothetical protein